MSKEKLFNEKEIIPDGDFNFIINEKLDFIQELEAHLSLLDKYLVDDETEIWQVDEKCQKLVDKCRNQMKRTKNESIKWVKLISDALSISEQEQKKIACKEDDKIQRIHTKLDELKYSINNQFAQHVLDTQTQTMQFPTEDNFLVLFSFVKNSCNQANNNKDESDPSQIEDAKGDGQLGLDEKAFREVLANRIRYNRAKIKGLERELKYRES
ncbi:3516_t:CDS:2 [Ambispora gerdemannii]|uniref:3516_t:CDS:1 n=1 Tax=Ambispora gerdemannii TaxID=144530 RepID=A0A9N9BG22_9GLOM|nr:3516_t:CDS:2 [Ambispora gerdemannii]